MSRIEERLADQFYEWELRGRGWHVWDRPVAPEPPFRPFLGHWLPREEIADDGRRPTLLSSIFAKLAGNHEPRHAEQEDEDEPEPDILVRDSLVEMRISLPVDLNVSADVFEQFLYSVGVSSEPIIFELVGKRDSIVAQFVAGRKDVCILEQQLAAHFPDAVFNAHENGLAESWNDIDAGDTATVEFGLSEEFMFPLATMRSVKLDPLVALVGALSQLQENEVGVFQVIFQQTRQPWAESVLNSVSDGAGGKFFVNRPELFDEARKKVSRPLFAAVVRVAAKTEQEGRAWEIAKMLAGALRVFSNPNGNELIPLENSDYEISDHEQDVVSRQCRRCGMLLNADELVSFVHLPSSSVRTPKLLREIKKTKAAPKIARHESGVVLGENTHGGRTVQVSLSAEQRVKHMHVVGVQGTGKSTFIFNLIEQDMRSGNGIAVLDPHGDLIDRILGAIPERRIEDVILLDPSDEEYSVGFNLLSAHSDAEKNLLASDLVSVFQRLSTSWGDQLNSVLNNAILAFLESSRGGTLPELRRFLIEPAFRNEFLTTVQDSEVVYYWKKAFPLLSGNKSVGPILTRLDTFLSKKPTRHMVSQRENRLDFGKIMDSGKIFLAKLSHGQVGAENSYLLGSLVMAKFQQAAMSRQNVEAGSRRDFFLYVDEFHQFITPSMAEILSGARKYRLGMILAHQDLRQLERDREVGGAVLANPYSRVCFRLGDDDAKKLADGFASFEPQEFRNLATGEAICRVERSDCDFNLSVSSPPQIDRTAAARTRERAVTASRRKYAVSRRDIEAALREQLDGAREKDGETPASKQPRPAGTARSIEAAPTDNEPGNEAAEPPPVPEPPKEEPASGPQALPAPESPEPPTKQPKPASDKGIGGHQHNLIRERIEGVARQLGYTATREKKTRNGGKIDLALEKAQRSIACEISVMTTIDHEVGNAAKCIKAGFSLVAMICGDEEKLRKIEKAVAGCVAEANAKSVRYFLPDQFIAHLQELSLRDAQAASDPSEKRHGKYRVRRSAAALTPEEAKQREDATMKVIADNLRRRRK